MADGNRATGRLWPGAVAAKAWEAPFLRIGHGGASAHARANSLRSIAVALEMGVDVVEFDVRPCQDGLVLLHDETVAGPGGVRVAVETCSFEALCAIRRTGEEPVAALAEALDFLKGRALLNLDLKAGGREAPVLDLLREKSMLADTLISSLLPDSLRRIRALEPAALTGYSYPQDTGGASRKGYMKPVVDAAVAAMRRALPNRLPEMIERAQSNAVMLYHKVVSPAAVSTVHGLGGKVFVWTVDDANLLERVRAMGVDGVASNRPELFAGLHSR